MKATEACLDLIKEFEGFQQLPYKCPGGEWTIGYGHVNKEKLSKITPAEAVKLLKSDIKTTEFYVNTLVKRKLNQNQFDALVSFVFNIGPTAFRNSTMLYHLNEGEWQDAANEFSRWIYADGKRLPGLMRRREAERKLFMNSYI